MPRNVRPAWLDVSTDNGPSRGTGPRARTGRLDAMLKIRDQGAVAPALDLLATGTDGALVAVVVTLLRAGTVTLPNGAGTIDLPIGSVVALGSRQ
jgi:hypothetical protein